MNHEDFGLPPFTKLSHAHQWMQGIVDAAVREQYDRLEIEAQIFVKMGYSPQELTIVSHRNGEKEISPLSALDES